MKVLVTQNRRGIGDLVIFLPYIFYISETLSVPVSLLVQKNCRAEELIANDPRINEIILLDRDDEKKSGSHYGLSGSINLIKTLRAKKFDKTYVFNSSLRFSIIMRLAGIKEVFQYPLGRKKNQHVIIAAQKLIKKSFNQNINPTSFINLSKSLVDYAKKQYLFDDHSTHILLGIGGSGPTKRIPIETFLNFMELISQKRKCKFYLGAGNNEIENGLVKKILESRFKEHCVSLNNMKISETLPIIKNCDIAVCNDTSFSHIASALSIKTIVLMSDTPLLYGSYSDFMYPILPDGITNVTHNTLGKDKINANEVYKKVVSLL